MMFPSRSCVQAMTGRLGKGRLKAVRRWRSLSTTNFILGKDTLAYFLANGMLRTN